MTAIARISNSKPFNSPSRQRPTANNKKLKSPWSYGRAYIPAFCILLLLLLSLGWLHLHWLGSKLWQIPRKKCKKLKIVA